MLLTKSRIYEKRLIKAEKTYETDIANFLYRRQITNAAENNWKKIIYYLIQTPKMHKSDDFTWCIYMAGYAGHKDLAEFFRSRYSHRYCDYFPNRAMYWAVRGGQPELVDYFIEHKADGWSWGVKGGIKYGNLNLMQYFLCFGNTDPIDVNDGIKESKIINKKKYINYFRTIKP